jgi:hypothetical protein
MLNFIACTDFNICYYKNTFDKNKKVKYQSDYAHTRYEVCNSMKCCLILLTWS